MKYKRMYHKWIYYYRIDNYGVIGFERLSSEKKIHQNLNQNKFILDGIIILKTFV
jgi:hypothetical protein